MAHTHLHLLVSRSALVAALSTTAVALVAIFVFACVWRRGAADVVVGTLAESYVNAGNLGLPLAVYLLGNAVAVVPALLFQLLVIAPIAFTVLDSQRSTARPGLGPIFTRLLANPIIVASLSGLLLAALPWKLPAVMFGPFALIGAAAPPLALLTFGMSIALPRAETEATRGANWCWLRCVTPWSVPRSPSFSAALSVWTAPLCWPSSRWPRCPRHRTCWCTRPSTGVVRAWRAMPEC